MARITQDVDLQGPDPHAVRVLYEREDQLEALARVREDAARGEGRMLCLGGEAGVGKTELLLDCAGAARAAGLTVCQARAGEFERSWAFGVARHLLDRLAAEVDQEIVLSGAGAIARSLLEPQAAGAPAPDASFAVMHGLYWCCVNATNQGPLLLAVDDAHWADDPSLRWLAFLGRRLPGHAIGVVTTVRSEDSQPGSAALAELMGEIGTGAVTVPPLSPTATLAITRERFGASASEAFAHACHRVTGGNLFFLRELHRALLAEGVPATPAGADRVGEVAPRGVTDAVLARLARLGSRVLEVARSLAVLGDGAAVEDLAGVAGVAVSEAVEALDALAREGLVTGGEGAAFSHPIVRGALYRELSPFGRTQRHGRAAEVLEHAGRPTNRVVAQLQRAEPVGAAWAIERLRRAAADAAARGAPDVAAQLLERALVEPLGAERRSALLLELGRFEVLARSSGALEHLREAFELAHDPPTRADAAVALATALLFAGQAQQANGFAREVQQQLGAEQSEQALQLEALTLTASPGTVSLAGWGPEVLDGRTPAARLLLGHLVFRRATAGDPAATVVPLARRALDDGRLALGPWNAPFFAPVYVLLFADRIEEALGLIDAALREARARGSLLWFASASTIRADANYRAGSLIDAEADARQVLETAESGLSFWEFEAAGALVWVLVEADRNREAEDALARAARAVTSTSPPYQHGFLSYTRALVAAAGGRFDEAAAAFLAAGERMLELDSGNPAMLDWRSQAALALTRLGDRERAARLTSEEVALARRFGAPRALGIALRADALVHDPVRIDELEEAVRVLAGSPARLEHARALVDYGAALRRARQRVAAREALLDGLDGAARCGAHALVKRARVELLAAGARPRHVLRHGVDALTASERRVALMAADGLSNQQIAQALFVTTRTVEAHLSRAYQKLNVPGRAGLAAVLAPDVTSRSSVGR